MSALDNLLSELRQRNIKIWLDGDRLRYRAEKDSLTPELLAQVKEFKTEIVEFLRQFTAASALQRPSLLPIERQGNLSLSFAQQRLWFINQFEPDSSSNNMPVVVRFKGNLNIEVLERSIRAVVNRHEILRTTFPCINGQPFQVIAPEAEINLSVVDLQDVAISERSEAAHRLATQEARKPFDLVNGPILRFLVLRLSDREHLLLWNMHCIICDGSASDIFYQELTAFYTAFIADQPVDLPDLPIQYADFSHWQRNWLQGKVLESYLNYWKNRLSGKLPVIQLPTDYPRPPLVQTYRGDRYARMLPKSLHHELMILSQKLGATLFTTLLATFKTLLHRYSEQKDLLISFVSAGRSQIETERMMGFFSNTLILRTNFDGNPTFADLLKQVHQGTLEAYAHEDLPFEKLVEELQPDQSQSRSPLFQVKFTLNPPWTNGQGMTSVQLPDLTITSLFGYIYHGKTKFDLILVTREQNEGLGAVFDFNAELFDVSTIKRIMDHFQTLLEAIVVNPNQCISDLPLMMPNERDLILKEWNQHNLNLSASKSTRIDRMFGNQSERTPHKVAIAYKSEKLTYQALDTRTNQLANYLQTLGLQTEAPVGVYLERSPLSIIGFLGILKAGGVYVPLNPNDSPDRLAEILTETKIEIILTQAAIAPSLTSDAFKVICLDTEWETIQQQSQEPPICNITDASNSLACIVYANSDRDVGDRPLGVSITHNGIIQLAQAHDCIKLSVTDSLLHSACLSSDIAVFEIWGSLLNGAELVISPTDSLSLEQLGKTIQQYQITTAWLPTRIFHQIVDEQLDSLKSVRQLLVGGDVLSPNQVKTLQQQLPDCQLFNIYSKLENTSLSLCYPVKESLPQHTTIPIGRPIANTQIYVLDSHGQLVPVGIVGELYIGGDRLAQGYYNRPDLTNSAFITNPFNQDTNTRLYKTGDLVRYLPDGNLEFVNSISKSVTIQGLRIETCRIETVLNQYPSVKESCVLVKVDANDVERLIAYVVFYPDRTVSINELRNFLREKLSAYMVPNAYIFLDAIPLTSMLELDLLALPIPDFNTQEIEGTFIAAQDEIEQKLLQIWQSLLGIQSISVQDNFFELGGNSLLAVRMFTQITENFSRNLPLSILLTAPTIAELANLLRKTESSINSSPLILIKSGNPDKPPLFCIHGGGFYVIIYRDLAMGLASDQTVYGLQGPGLDSDTVPIIDMLEDIAADYIKQIQTVQPEGPYFLSGLSNGGNIALEMAQQLQAQGQKVALLAMFDSQGPNSFQLLPPFPRLISSLQYVLRYSLPRFTESSLKDTKGTFSKVCKRLKALQEKSQISHNSPESSNWETASQAAEPTQLSPSQPQNIEYWLNDISRYILDHSPWAFLSPTVQLKGIEAGAIAEKLRKLEEAFSKAQRAYRPKPYAGKITLFRALESPPGYYIDPQLGWSEIALDGVEIHKIPGHHIGIMGSPVLAEKMKTCLEKAQGDDDLKTQKL